MQNPNHTLTPSPLKSEHSRPMVIWVTKRKVWVPIVTQADYSNVSIGKLVSQCFENSYIDAVSALVKDERISIDELKDLINRIEQED